MRAPERVHPPRRTTPPHVESPRQHQERSQLAQQLDILANDPALGAVERDVAAASRDAAQYSSEVWQQERRAVPASGIGPVDVMGDLLNQYLTPFVTAPPDNVLQAANQYVGGVVQLLQLPFDVIDRGIAILTAPVASFFEAPAAVLYVPYLGTPHAHNHPPSLVPPAPPVPLPSLGTVIGSGCLSVHICGIPAARAGDVGLAVTCGSLFPPFMIITGSSNVFFGGARAARMLDMAIHCNPIIPPGLSLLSLGIGLATGALGTAAEASAGNAMSAAMQAAQTVADAAAEVLKAMVGKDPGIPPTTIGALLLGAPTVMVGGVPMPPADMLGDIGRALGLLKADDVDPHNPNRHPHEGEADPNSPRRNRRGMCEC